MSCVFEGEILNSRPPWYGPSKSTKDIEHANKALLYGLNPNDPAVDEAMLKHHNKFGQLRSRSRSKTSPNMDFGLGSKSRRATHRSISVSSVLNNLFIIVLAVVGSYQIVNM